MEIPEDKVVAKLDLQERCSAATIQCPVRVASSALGC